MKKYLALLLAMVLTLALCACASAQVQQTEPAKQEDAESALPQEQPESEEQEVETSVKMVTVNGFTYTPAPRSPQNIPPAYELPHVLCAGRCPRLSGSSAPCDKTSRRPPCGAAASYSEIRRTPFPVGSRYR